ncbi:MAG TPA: ABC transporter permease [Methanospirillum sp.]|nr:ABC transporter permease [Methanospirillum sp.]
MIFFELAKRNIRIHLLRSILAMLGIVIGVVAISSMGILGNSMVLTVTENLTQVGNNVIVTPYTGGSGNFGPPHSGGSSENLKITDQNFQEIKRLVSPNTAYFVLSGSDRMRIGSENITGPIYGLDTDIIPDIMNLQEGSYLRGDSGCLIGPNFAADNNLKVGSRIQISDKGMMRVIGIIESRGMSFDVSTDSALVVSKDWFKSAYNQTGYNSVVVRVKDLDNIEFVKGVIEKKFNKRNNKIFQVTDTRKTLETIFSTFNQISTFVSAIGGIALLVAGVSIFNIMMMSVNERVREIGIMRSIGALKKEVMSMFLYEAAILGLVGSLTGGIFSLIGGYGISSLMLRSTKYVFVPSSLVSVAYGIFFGISICILCSIYPAWRAANMNPIDALRHE